MIQYEFRGQAHTVGFSEVSAIARSGSSSLERYKHEPTEYQSVRILDQVAAILSRPGKSKGGGIELPGRFAMPWDNDPSFVAKLKAFHRSTRDNMDAKEMLKRSTFLREAQKKQKAKHAEKYKERQREARHEDTDEYITPEQWTPEEMKKLRDLNGAGITTNGRKRTMHDFHLPR